MKRAKEEKEEMDLISIYAFPDLLIKIVAECQLRSTRSKIAGDLVRAAEWSVAAAQIENVITFLRNKRTQHGLPSTFSDETIQ